MNRILFLLLAVLAPLAITPRANASWAYVPLELRLSGAEYVVVGKIDKIADNILRGERSYDVGTIKVQEVLKGPKDLKEVKLMWPGKAPLRVSTDISYREGQEGIWILFPDPDEPGVYLANYPSDFQKLDQLAEVKKRLKSLEAIVWSEPVDGLQIGAFVEVKEIPKGGQVRRGGKPNEPKPIVNARAYIVLRNAGKILTHAVYYFQDQPLSLDLIGPDGESRPLAMGEFQGQLPPMNKYHFLPLAPDEMKGLGYGLAVPVISKPGKYSVKFTYQNQRTDEDDLVVGAVWRGKLAGSATFEVK